MAREPAVIEVDLAPIDLDALATDCWESGDFGDPPADATLVVEEVGPIAADRDLLRRAIGNLLGNAFDHAGDAPAVRVGVDDRGIYVADDGPGLAADERSEHGDVTEFGVSNDGGRESGSPSSSASRPRTAGRWRSASRPTAASRRGSSARNRRDKGVRRRTLGRVRG